MSALAPKFGIMIQNDSGEDIPPRSVVVVTSVEITESDDYNESVAIHHVEKFSGQAGNIFVTGDVTITAGTETGPATSSRWWSADKSYGTAYSDQFIYVSIDPAATAPLPGDNWGPIDGEWFLSPTGNGFICQGYPADMDATSTPRAMFYRAMPGNWQWAKTTGTLSTGDFNAPSSFTFNLWVRDTGASTYKVATDSLMLGLTGYNITDASGTSGARVRVEWKDGCWQLVGACCS